VELYDIARRMFLEIEGNAEGKKVLGLFRFVLQFQVAEGEPFFVNIDRGRYSFHRGVTLEPDPMCVLTCESDRRTFFGLMVGQLEPVETNFSGKMFIPNAFGKRVLANCSLRLLRIGQESMLKALLNGDAQVGQIYGGVR